MSSSCAEACAHVAGLPAIVSIAPITLPSPERGVDLHVRVSLPIAGDALPVIIFSHGNGQSLYAYGPLADYWAAHGFVVIQPTHLDSRMLGLAPDDPRRPQLWRFREEDLAAVLDGLDRIESEAPMIREGSIVRASRLPVIRGAGRPPVPCLAPPIPIPTADRRSTGRTTG
ncbi:hypothetical protein ABCW43_24805 [Neorhizobium sp. IRAMC:178]|uniref:alpha/beta hydrolase family protein n=1 Tax=Neorhizobium tunisiense TaxID=3144793 RepID=UPI0031F68D77